MTREEREFAKSRIEYLLKINSFVFDERDKQALDMAIQALSQEPSNAVSRGVFEQVMGERDIAIEQLHELGYELGQKIDPCTDAVSREAVLNCFKKWQPYMATRLWDFEKELSELPSVTQKGDVKNV